jgi:hypothetical protein
MIKFNIKGSSLEVVSIDNSRDVSTILLLTPLKNIAFNSLELYKDIPMVSLYNINVGFNENLLTAQLSKLANESGEFFTLDSFILFASSHFGMTITEGGSSVPSGNIDGLTHKFPIQSGQTISKNQFVQVDDAGGIFGVTATGSVPISLPIGLTQTYSEEVAPEQDRDNLVRWIDDTNFIFFFSHYDSSTRSYEAYLIGGSVDKDGKFSYKKEPTKVSDGRYIEFDLDKTTLSNIVVNGLCSTVSNTRNANAKGIAFEYTIETQEFKLGEPFTEDYGSGDSRNFVATDSLGAGKYLIASTYYFPFDTIYNPFVRIATVTDLVITISVKTPIEQSQGRGNIVNINDQKAILLFLSSSGKIQSTILNIDGNVITIGNTSIAPEETFNGYQSTSKLTANNKFYCATTERNGARVIEPTYDTASDTVIWGTKGVVIGNGFALFNTDMSFYPTTNVVVVSGVENNVPVLNIVDFASASVIGKTVGTTSGNNVGCDVNSIGGVVFSYASDGGQTATGLSSYGTLGDIVSTLDPERTIGVASDSLGNVEISGSVITDSSLALVINKTVYVNGLGIISTTNADGSIAVGYSISSTSFILNISK